MCVVDVRILSDFRAWREAPVTYTKTGALFSGIFARSKNGPEITHVGEPNENFNPRNRGVFFALFDTKVNLPWHGSLKMARFGFTPVLKHPFAGLRRTCPAGPL